MQILILGDSTSFTGGYRPCSYPVALAESATWPAGTRIVNPSVAGLTSADAARFFSRHAHARPDAIVIYLGNCDACATLYPKGRANWIGRAIAHWNRHRRVGRRLNPFRPFTFDPTYRAAIERPEHPADFAYNLEKIIRRAGNARIVLVVPMANATFFAGSGKGNFVFYRIFGVPASVSDEAIGLPGILAAALRDESDGNPHQAMDRYRTILEQPANAQTSDEVRQIAANNLAVLRAENGESREAVASLEEILATNIRPEIVLFNLYRIELHDGNIVRADEFKKRAYEQDYSIYRAREPYRDIIRRLAIKFPRVQLVDMSDFQAPFDFIDHCHLIKDKQIELANRIRAKLAPVPPGIHPANLETCPVTPEYAFGINSSLSELLYLRDGTSPMAADRNRIEQEARLHPLFHDGADISVRPPDQNAELGRFADAYITRLLAPYLAEAERVPELDELRTSLGVAALDERLVLLPPAQRRRISTEREIDVAADRARIAGLKAAIAEQLLSIATSPLQMGKRYRTVMYRYFRESIRFGSHSRLSMLYDPAPLETAAEAVLGLGVVAHRCGLDETAWCRSAAGLIAQIGAALDLAARDWLNAYLRAQPLRADDRLPGGADLAREIAGLVRPI